MLFKQFFILRETVETMLLVVMVVKPCLAKLTSWARLIIIGPAHTCATPEPYGLPPPLSSGLWTPLKFREKSYCRCTKYPSNPTRKRIQIIVILEMSSRHQQIIGNTNSFNSFNLISTANFISEGDDEGRQILQWLSPLEPQQRHQGVRTDRLNSVGSWVLETSEFRKWRDTEDGRGGEQVLFCYGNPGVGKTYVR